MDLLSFSISHNGLLWVDAIDIPSIII